MSILKKIKKELNYLKAEDIAQIFLFLLAVPCSLAYKLFILITKKEIWLVCEDKNEARDNGFCFFKYLNEHQPQISSYYAINKKSKDFEKVAKTGKTVSFGSLFHWILYFCCKHNISSQKAGKPNGAICYVLEVFGIIKSKSVFLQHGITINKGEWLFYKNTKMRLFVCGAKPEYEFIKDYFGYPEDNVKYLGFCRFDDYHGISPNKKQIVLMPSWREWISSKNEYSNVFEDTKNFKNTEYYQKYQELINDKKLAEFLESNDLTLYFYPHRNMQKYIEHFTTASKNIVIVSNQNSDIRQLLIHSAAMITDYSSVALDFAYMQKPVLYYQFDYKRFRQAQYAEGYFDYKNAGLGTVCDTCQEVVDELIRAYNNNFVVSEDFKKAHNAFYPLFDNCNNQRIFEEIKGIK